MVVVPYCDRYQITDPAPLGVQSEATAQKIDRARAETALPDPPDYPRRASAPRSPDDAATRPVMAGQYI